MRIDVARGVLAKVQAADRLAGQWIAVEEQGGILRMREVIGCGWSAIITTPFSRASQLPSGATYRSALVRQAGKRQKFACRLDVFERPGEKLLALDYDGSEERIVKMKAGDWPQRLFRLTGA
jgi:hypothetical protein